MENENQEKNQNKAECSVCGSKFVYIRIKDKEIVCRSCGKITSLEEEKEE